jgi:pimeloyl-ACP methyl ester carboxylesterase
MARSAMKVRAKAAMRMAIALGCAGLAAACAQGPGEPDVMAIYARAAAIDTEKRRPVITIPGTLGSRLRDRETGVVMWGDEDRLSVDPVDPGATELIALPIGRGDEPLRALRDDVRPDGVVRTARANLLGATIEVDVYGNIIDTLIAAGYDFRETRAEEIENRDQNLDAFEFPYDWRRSIVEAAQDLDYFIQRKKRQVEEERRRVLGAANEPVVFDIVAHSMGTLVARYYLRYGAQDLPEDGSLPELTWEGAKNVDTVVLIAPPNAGSVIAADNLVNGKTLGPLQPFYDAALLSTHHSVYQLMPRARHNRIRTVAGQPLDMYDIETWRRFGWGLAGPDADPTLAKLLPDVADPAERRRLADAHLRKLLAHAEQFHRAMDLPATVPPHVKAYLVIGGGFRTPASATVDAATGEFVITGYEEGDGVVLRASSLLDERQGDPERYDLGLRSPVRGNIFTLFIPSEHVELTHSAVFGDNLLFWLLESGRAPDGLEQPTLADDSGAAGATVGRRAAGVLAGAARGVGQGVRNVGGALERALDR